MQALTEGKVLQDFGLETRCNYDVPNHSKRDKYRSFHQIELFGRFADLNDSSYPFGPLFGHFGTPWSTSKLSNVSSGAR